MPKVVNVRAAASASSSIETSAEECAQPRRHSWTDRVRAPACSTSWVHVHATVEKRARQREPDTAAPVMNAVLPANSLHLHSSHLSGALAAAGRGAAAYSQAMTDIAPIPGEHQINWPRSARDPPPPSPPFQLGGSARSRRRARRKSAWWRNSARRLHAGQTFSRRDRRLSRGEVRSAKTLADGRTRSARPDHPEEYGTPGLGYVGYGLMHARDRTRQFRLSLGRVGAVLPGDASDLRVRDRSAAAQDSASLRLASWSAASLDQPDHGSDQRLDGDARREGAGSAPDGASVDHQLADRRHRGRVGEARRNSIRGFIVSATPRASTTPTPASSPCGCR